MRTQRTASEDDDEEVWGEDSFVDEPSAAEGLPPVHSDFKLTLSCALSLPLTSTVPRLTFSSLKRSGDTLESESAKERKKEERGPGDAGYTVFHKTPRNK